MNLYRITKVDGEWAYRGENRLPVVRCGDRRLAATVVRLAKAENGRRRHTSRIKDMPYCPVRVTVEGATNEGWVDVSPEFWEGK